MKQTVKALLSAATLVGALILVSAAVLVGALFYGGVITEQKVSDVVMVFKGDLASPVEDEVAEEEPSGPLEIKREEQLKKLVAEWQEQKSREEEELAARRDGLESVARELETVRLEIDTKVRKHQGEKASFERARAAEVAAAKEEGFLSAAERYSKMDAKVVAELLYGLTDEEILRYLRVFKTQFGAEILTALKKVDEESRPGAARGAMRLNRAARLQEMLGAGRIEPALETAAAAAGN